MMRGNKPRPTILKMLDGNPGKRPLNENEPQFADGICQQPDWFGEHAKCEWARITEALGRNGLLKTIYSSVVIGACVAFERGMKADKTLAEEGFAREDGFKRPECTVSAEAWRTHRLALCELGLTPASSSKVIAPNRERQTTLKGFIRSHA